MGLIEQAEATGGIDVVNSGGRTHVRMWGEVDGGLRDQASASMALVLATTDPVVVDATDVRFIDSSGLAFILQLHLAAGESGQSVTLRDPNRAVLELLDMIGMGGAILVEDASAPGSTAPSGAAAAS